MMIFMLFYLVRRSQNGVRKLRERVSTLHVAGCFVFLFALIIIIISSVSSKPFPAPLACPHWPLLPTHECSRAPRCPFQLETAHESSAQCVTVTPLSTGKPKKLSLLSHLKAHSGHTDHFFETMCKWHRHPFLTCARANACTGMCKRAAGGAAPCVVLVLQQWGLRLCV